MRLKNSRKKEEGRNQKYLDAFFFWVQFLWNEKILKRIIVQSWEDENRKALLLQGFPQMRSPFFDKEVRKTGSDHILVTRRMSQCLSFSAVEFRFTHLHVLIYKFITTIRCIFQYHSSFELLCHR